MDPHRRTRALAAAAAAAACYAAFSPVLDNGFVFWDDPVTIVANPRIGRMNPQNLLWMFTDSHLTAYQPLGWLSFALIHRFTGLEPAGFHRASLWIYCLNAALLAWLIGAMIELTRKSSKPAPAASAAAAALGAMLFCLHPMNVEAVAWATNYPGVLCVTFFLGSLLTYLAIPDSGPNRRPWTMMCLLLFLISGLCRWRGFALPVALLVLDVHPLRRLGPDPRSWLNGSSRIVLRQKLPFLAVSALIILANAVAKNQGTSYEWSPSSLEFSLGAIHYLGKLLIPWGFIPQYALEGSGGACLAATVALTASAWMLRGSWPALLGAWVFYLVSLSPTLFYVPSRGPVFVSDNYFYLAGMGFAPLTAAGILELRRRFRYSWTFPLLLAAGLGTALALGGMSRRQCRVWKDSLSLWSHALSVDPLSHSARINLGIVLFKTGRIPEALALFDEHLRVHPEDELARKNIVEIKAKLSKRPAVKPR